MKKILCAALLCGALLLSCRNAGTITESGVSKEHAEAGAETTTSNSSSPESDLAYTIKCVDGSLHGNRMMYDIRVYNDSDYYAYGLVEFIFTDDETDQQYVCGFPLENIAPNDYDFHTCWLPIGVYDEDRQNVEVNILRMDFSDSIITNPEITVENVGEYVYTNYDIGNIYNNKYTISATVHNCTLKYFTGYVTVNAYGPDGILVESKTKFIENSDPGTDDSIVLMADIYDTYTFETVITDFEFTRNPKS